MIERCKTKIIVDSITLIEANQSDKEILGKCLSAFDYIREYTGWDAEESDPAQELLDHADLPKNWNTENDRLYLIYENDSCVGYSNIYEGAFIQDKVFLGFFGILPDFQKKGYSDRAYKILESEIRMNGYKTIRLNVGTRNIAAMKFWIKNGYHRIVDYSYYDNGFLDVNLEKDL